MLITLVATDVNAVLRSAAMVALPKVRFITGKGGVGKTVVATALALAEARAGKRVLLAELHGRDRVAALLGVEPPGYNLREVFEDLSLIDINPQEAMREYVLLNLRFELLYKAVFENKWVRHFVRLVPSLGELVMLGKIWYHSQEVVRGRARFDVIVVDAPATGHAMALFKAPQAVSHSVPPGPMRDNALLLHAMLVDPAQTMLQVVTTPEEMPVTEALELTAAAHALGMACGPMIINQRLDPLPALALETLQALPADDLLKESVSALKLREDRRCAGEAELSRLPDTVRASATSLPRLPHAHLTAVALEDLVKHLRPTAKEAL